MRTLFLLSADRPPGSIQERIHAETLQHLRRSLSESSEHVFESDLRLLALVRERQIEVVVGSDGLNVQSTLVLRGLNVVVIYVGGDPAVAELADIHIDAASRASLTGFTGPRYLLPSMLDKVPIDDLAALYRLPPARIREEVDSAGADKELPSVASLFMKMKWDSDFFGINVGFVSCLRLTPGIERLSHKFIKREKIDVFEYLCNCHDKLSVTTAEQAGYSFVDMRLTFEKSLAVTAPPVAPKPSLSLRYARPSDVPRLREIATDIYRDSRYYFDGNFDQAKVVEFYQNWVEKAVLGTFDKDALVVCDGETPVGYCTSASHTRRSAKIGVFGLDERVRGSGAGRYLLDGALHELARQGKEHVEVVTQGRNYSAQRLYQRAGFITQKTELWYHKWLH